jgi:hypothetical protein
MRIVLEEKEAYAKFIELAKARNMTTRELGVLVIMDHIIKSKK